MKTSKRATTIVANEIINLLDSSTLSSESKNSILVDYLDRTRCQGFYEGREALISELILMSSDESTETVVKAIIKELPRIKSVDLIMT